MTCVNRYGGAHSHGAVAQKFEGHRYGDVNVSFYLVGSPPGSGAERHSHPCEEVFVVQEGVAAEKA